MPVEGKLLPADGATGDAFGTYVAMDTGTIVVGAPLDDAGLGAAYVFERDLVDPSSWVEVRKLVASDGEAGDEFGTSVAVSGDTIVVGARNDPGVSSQTGSAYVFSKDAGGPSNWGEVKKLRSADQTGVTRYGTSVSVSGDSVVVGAMQASPAGAQSGAAYVYDRDTGGVGNWGQTKELVASDAIALDWFGFSVSIDLDTVAVGARCNDAGGADAGAVYIYGRDVGGSGNWGEVTKIVAADAGAGDEFGMSVALDGSTVLVGARFDDRDTDADLGAAYVFERDAGGSDNWGEVRKLIASDADENDLFGWWVAIDGSTAVVGARQWLKPGLGAAYLFKRDAGGVENWGEVARLEAEDGEIGDQFGQSVAIGGDFAIVAAHWDDDTGEDSGSVYSTKVGPCGDGVVDLGECCDLGSANGPGSGCSTSCECQGCCVSNCAEPPPLECATAAECSGGSEGCCGNGILETGEACDDGNLDGGDCCAIDCTVPASCTPACPGVFGPQLLNPVSMKVRLRDLALDGEYERWTTSRGGKKGDMILRFGQDIDPSTELTRLVFLENDGSNEVRQLGAFAIQPEDWTKCVEKPKGTDDGICKLKDKTETISDPDGVRTAIVKEKGAVVKYKFKGNELGGILKPNTSQLRVCLYVGDDAGTSVLDCEEKGGGRLIKCNSTN